MASITYTAENLDNTRGEILLSQLAELEIAIRGKWRRLDDDGISSDDRGGDLAAGEMNREVPGNDSNGHTEGCVSDNDLLVVVLLNNLFIKLDVGQGTEPVYTGLNLSDGELVLNTGLVPKIEGINGEGECSRSRGTQRTGLPCSEVSNLPNSGTYFSRPSAKSLTAF